MIVKNFSTYKYLWTNYITLTIQTSSLKLYNLNIITLKPKLKEKNETINDCN